MDGDIWQREQHQVQTSSHLSRLMLLAWLDISCWDSLGLGCFFLHQRNPGPWSAWVYMSLHSSDSLWISASEFLGAEEWQNGETSGPTATTSHPALQVSKKREAELRQTKLQRTCSFLHLSRFCFGNLPRNLGDYRGTGFSATLHGIVFSESIPNWPTILVTPQKW